MTRIRRLSATAAVILGSIAAANSVRAQPLQLGDTPCVRPPVLHCPDQGCTAETVTNGGPVVEPQTGRSYFLDYPCNLRRGDTVTFILSLHGGGSYGNWQRHYFPLLDYVDKYRLVVATPYSPRRVWGAEDDGYLQKSLSGGRVGGQAGRAANFGVPPLSGAAQAGRGAAPPPALPAGALTPPPPPTCDFSHVFTTGEHEISALPPSSERARMYGYAAAPTHRELVDTKAGYVYDGTRQNPGSKAWGLLPRPGTAAIHAYGGCRDKRLVADVVRLDKGHTEGLEPRVTEELVKMMLAARGGKIQHGG